MTVANNQYPTQSAFGVEQGNTEWGRYIGFNFSPLFRITNQGNNVGVDLNPSALGNTGAYGDGSDGAALFDGVTVVPGATLGGSTYTLDRDVLYTDVVVSAGIEVRTFNFRLLANGTLTNNGVIHNDGNAGVLDAAGGALAAQTLGAAAAGGAGSNGIGAGTAGNATAFSLDNGTGIGGDGGDAGAELGGVAGAFVPLIAVLGTARSLPGALNGMASSPSAWTSIQGGSGGGGGASDDATTLGGGGGSGGGVMVLIAYTLVNNGVIRVAGGAGAAASGAGGNGGGGGGGGGGTLLCITRARSGAGTYTAPGGAGGAVVAAGVAGADGAAGNVVQIAA